MRVPAVAPPLPSAPLLEGGSSNVSVAPEARQAECGLMRREVYYFLDGGLKLKSTVAAPPETVAVPVIAGSFSCQASIS